MFSIYNSGLAPRLKAQIDAPSLTPDQARRFVASLLKGATRHAIKDQYMWSKYRTQEGQRYFNDGDKRHFWAKASQAFKNEVVRCASQAIFDQLHGLAGANPNVLKGIDAISEEAARQAVRDAMDEELSLYEAGNVPKPTPEPSEAPTNKVSGGINISSPEGVSAAAVLPYLERAVTMDLHKSLAPEDRPNIEHFVPRDPSALDMYRRFGTVPNGYVDLVQISKMSPAYALEMQKSGIPMLQEAYFKRDVAQRVAADMACNTDNWIEFLRTFAPINDVALQKGHNPQDVTMLDRLGGESTVRQAPMLALQAIAECYAETDLRKAHDIIAGFSGDPSAVMAAIHFDDLPKMEKAAGAAMAPTVKENLEGACQTEGCKSRATKKLTFKGNTEGLYCEDCARELKKGGNVIDNCSLTRKGYEELADQADALFKSYGLPGFASGGPTEKDVAPAPKDMGGPYAWQMDNPPMSMGGPSAPSMATPPNSKGPKARKVKAAPSKGPGPSAPDAPRAPGKISGPSADGFTPMELEAAKKAMRGKGAEPPDTRRPLMTEQEDKLNALSPSKTAGIDILGSTVTKTPAGQFRVYCPHDGGHTKIVKDARAAMNQAAQFHFEYGIRLKSNVIDDGEFAMLKALGYEEEL